MRALLFCIWFSALSADAYAQAPSACQSTAGQQVHSNAFYFQFGSGSEMENGNRFFYNCFTNKAVGKPVWFSWAGLSAFAMPDDPVYFKQAGAFTRKKLPLWYGPAPTKLDVNTAVLDMAAATGGRESYTEPAPANTDPALVPPSGASRSRPSTLSTQASFPVPNGFRGNASKRELIEYIENTGSVDRSLRMTFSSSVQLDDNGAVVGIKYSCLYSGGGWLTDLPPDTSTIGMEIDDEALQDLLFKSKQPAQLYFPVAPSDSDVGNPSMPMWSISFFGTKQIDGSAGKRLRIQKGTMRLIETTNGLVLAIIPIYYYRY